MVQVAPQGLVAITLVGAGKEDEFVPGIVHHLRRHGDHLVAGLVADVEIIAQAVKYQIELIIA